MCLSAVHVLHSSDRGKLSLDSPWLKRPSPLGARDFSIARKTSTTQGTRLLHGSEDLHNSGHGTPPLGRPLPLGAQDSSTRKNSTARGMGLHHLRLRTLQLGYTCSGPRTQNSFAWKQVTCSMGTTHSIALDLEASPTVHGSPPAWGRPHTTQITSPWTLSNQAHHLQRTWQLTHCKGLTEPTHMDSFQSLGQTTWDSTKQT